MSLGSRVYPTTRNPETSARAARREEEIIGSACAHIGVPRPAPVTVMRHSRFFGVLSAPEFTPFPQSAARARSGSDRLQRMCVHAELEFEEVVERPVELGPGRCLGVGLFEVVKR